MLNRAPRKDLRPGADRRHDPAESRARLFGLLVPGSPLPCRLRIEAWPHRRQPARHGLVARAHALAMRPRRRRRLRARLLRRESCAGVECLLVVGRPSAGLATSEECRVALVVGGAPLAAEHTRVRLFQRWGMLGAGVGDRALDARHSLRVEERRDERERPVLVFALTRARRHASRRLDHRSRRSTQVVRARHQPSVGRHPAHRRLDRRRDHRRHVDMNVDRRPLLFLIRVVRMGHHHKVHRTERGRSLSDEPARMSPRDVRSIRGTKAGTTSSNRARHRLTYRECERSSDSCWPDRRRSSHAMRS